MSRPVSSSELVATWQRKTYLGNQLGRIPVQHIGLEFRREQCDQLLGQLNHPVVLPLCRSELHFHHEVLDVLLHDSSDELERRELHREGRVAEEMEQLRSVSIGMRDGARQTLSNEGPISSNLAGRSGIIRAIASRIIVLGVCLVRESTPCVSVPLR